MKVPHAPEAEASVLSAVMLRNDLFDMVSDLQPDDFYTPKHRAAWEAMRTLLHSGRPVDIVQLEEQMRQDETLGMAGGLEGIAKMADRIAPTHNVGEHARIVQAKGRARKAQAILSIAADRASTLDTDQVDDFVAEVQSELAQVSAGAVGLLSFGQVCDAAIEQAKSREAGTLTPFGWGLSELDHIYHGGMMPGELVVVAGRPGMGKTVLGLQSGFESAQRRECPLLFELEMMAAQLGRRAIASRGEISNRDAKAPATDNAWARAIAAREFFAQLSGKVWPRRIHLDRLLAIARSWRRSTRKPGPIIVDYLQLLDVRGHGRLDKREKVELITRELKLLAMELEVPVVLLSQLNRKVEDRDDKRPRIADLRDSGSIEQDADSVVMLYRKSVYDADANPFDAECIVPKCREGVPGTAHVRFEGHFSRFLDSDYGDRNAPGMEWRG